MCNDSIITILLIIMCTESAKITLTTKVINEIVKINIQLINSVVLPFSIVIETKYHDFYLFGYSCF